MADFPRRLSSLNGWQRAWCVVASIWFLVVLALLANHFPDANIEKIYREQSGISPNTPEVIQEMFRCGSLDDHPAEQAKCRDGLAQDYESFDDNVLLSLQFKAIIRGIAFWSVSSAALYLLGMGVAWIRKGFQSPP
jgi:hypothetical protein